MGEFEASNAKWRMPAGSSRALRLDPFALPVRFAASDAAADERVRQVELHRERVVVRRSLRGMRMAVNVPVSAFAGIALQADARRGRASRRHPRTQGSDRCRCRFMSPSKPTMRPPNGAPGAMCSVCRCWSRKMTAACASRMRESAACASNASAPRRRRRSASASARPSMPLRRKLRPLTDATPVHRGEREIIASN